MSLCPSASVSMQVRRIVNETCTLLHEGMRFGCQDLNDVAEIENMHACKELVAGVISAVAI